MRDFIDPGDSHEGHDGLVSRFGLSLMAKDNIQEVNQEFRPKSANHFPSISLISPSEKVSIFTPIS
jgi:hypothetical protein